MNSTETQIRTGSVLRLITFFDSVFKTQFTAFFKVLD